jgi:hypothetical protein
MPGCRCCRWQEAAKQEDALARQTRIDKLRQEMSTAAGAAAAAKGALQAAKAAAGAALKQHRAALEAERGQQQQQEQQANAEKVQEVAAGREKARKAQVWCEGSSTSAEARLLAGVDRGWRSFLVACVEDTQMRANTFMSCTSTRCCCFRAAGCMC